jgi:integrase
MLRVTTKGKKTFSVSYKVVGEGGESKTGRPLTGQAYRQTLDRFPRISTATARAQARPILASASEGINPQQARFAEHRERRTNTVASVAKQFIEQAKATVKSWKRIERTLQLHVLPAIGDRPIREIKREDVHSLLDTLTKAKQNGAAAGVQKHVRGLFEYALDRELVDKNPAKNLRRPELKPTKNARRNLDDAELRAVWIAAGTLGYPFGDWVRLLILTGQRRADWFNAQWGEIDSEKQVLEIPASRYKTKIDHVVPLVGPAWEIVSTLPRHSAGDFLFSSRGGKVPIAGFSKAKKELDKLALEVLRRDDPDATLAKYTFHDFRSSHKTRLAALGIIQEHRNAVHGHVQKGMDAIYNKHEYAAEKRAALDLYATHLMGIVK